MSALWLLEAKAFLKDDRSAAAYSVKYWLKPGGPYTVGRQGADLVVEEDKSISRRHAELSVLLPSAWASQPAEHTDDQAGASDSSVAGGPHILVKDLSKYGTFLNTSQDASTFKDPPLGVGAPPARVPPGAMLRFGFKSPYKLYHQNWVLYLSSEQRREAGAGAVKALEKAAAETGLPLTGDLPDHPGTRVLVAAGATLCVDETVLLALLRRYPVVGSGWLLEWRQQRVWRNERPQEAAHPVQLQYTAGNGQTAHLPGPAALLGALDRQCLAGTTLLWLPPARGSGALQAAAGKLGASNLDVAAKGRATAAASGSGAVLVRGSADDAVPAAYRNLPWTTPQLLTAGMLEGDPQGAVHPPSANATPASAAARCKGRGKRGAAGGSVTGGGRGKGRAAAAHEDKGRDSGAETDATDVSEADLEHLRDTQRQLALDDVAAGTAKKASPAAEGAGATAGVPAADAYDVANLVQEDEEQGAAAATAAQGSHGAHGKQAAVTAANAAGTTTAPTSRKRRQPEPEPQQETQEEQEQAAARPSAAKKRRQGQTPAGASALAQRPQQAAPMPSAEGWQSKSHQKEGHGVGDARCSATDRPSAAKPKPAAPTADGGGAKPRRRQRIAAPTAAAEDGEDNDGHANGIPPVLTGKAAAAGSGDAAVAEVEGAVEVEQDEGAVIAYMPLVKALPPAPTHNGSSGAQHHGGPNFKAFRKAGATAADAGQGQPARRFMAFDPQPYQEDAGVDADAFMRQEQERRRRAKAADELFTANVKAKKAPQLPDADGDTPPQSKAAGRGRGGKKVAAPAAGQQSMLNFMPAAGRGAGRGRGRGRGKSHA